METMKYAILIGCNYANLDDGSALYGCINDVLSSQKYLTQNGYDSKNIYLLTDDVLNATTTPTKANIFKHINEITSKMKSGDTLFFHMSSHGGSVPCTKGDEKDGYDETVYGAGLEQIIDDEIKDKLVNNIPKGCKLRGIMDNCHSASNWDLPWEYKNSKKYEKESTPCKLSDDILCISGCKDDDYSSDTVNATGVPMGALTMTVLDILNQNPKNFTWRDLLVITRYNLKKNGYTQIPQLAMGRKGLEKREIDI
jgi:hypothetical protein